MEIGKDMSGRFDVAWRPLVCHKREWDAKNWVTNRILKGDTGKIYYRVTRHQPGFHYCLGDDFGR